MQEVAEAQLAHAGLRDHFAAVVSANSVRRLKPAPEPYRAVAGSLPVEWHVGYQSEPQITELLARTTVTLYPYKPEIDMSAVLMRSLGATRWMQLWKAELPASLPFLFSGIRIAATVSVIGAVFGEWAGADRGLGLLVLRANNQLQTPRLYAGTVLLTLMAIALFAFVSLVERVAIPWRRDA